MLLPTGGPWTWAGSALFNKAVSEARVRGLGESCYLGDLVVATLTLITDVCTFDSSRTHNYWDITPNRSFSILRTRPNLGQALRTFCKTSRTDRDSSRGTRASIGSQLLWVTSHTRAHIEARVNLHLLIAKSSLPKEFQALALLK
jgi:hypothetical protein